MIFYGVNGCGRPAAYRRKAVFSCLDDWINQTFMGKTSDIGEDRGMTNMILKQGYHVLLLETPSPIPTYPKNTQDSKMSGGEEIMFGRILQWRNMYSQISGKALKQDRDFCFLTRY